MTDEKKMPVEIFATASYAKLSNGCDVHFCLSGDAVALTGPHGKYFHADLVAEKDRRIAELERQVNDLHEANDRYLNRARKAEEALRKQAEQNVLAARGSCDAPGFDACVDAETKRMEGE